MSQGRAARFKSTYLVELDDVWVANLFEDLDLSGDPLNVLLVVDFFFFKNFHGDLGAIHNA